VPPRSDSRPRDERGTTGDDEFQRGIRQQGDLELDGRDAAGKVEPEHLADVDGKDVRLRIDRRQRE
jgi:hypothetical protein